MKLKQRVLMMLSLFLVMTTLFIIGIQLGSPPDKPEDSSFLRPTQSQEVKGPPIDDSVRHPEFDPRLQRKYLKFSKWSDDGDVNRDPNSNVNRPRPPFVPQEREPVNVPNLIKDPRANLPRLPNLPNIPHSINRDPHLSQEDLLNNLARDSPKEKQLVNRLLAQMNRTGLHSPPLPPPVARERKDFLKEANVPEKPKEKDPQFTKDINKEIHRTSELNITKGLNVGGSKSILTVPPDVSQRDPWVIWRQWVREDSLYPQNAFWSDEMNHILVSMATAPITSFGVGHKGTQLKASLFLGKQRTAFKPMRYPRSEVIAGDPYAGCDRHNGEIAGFHLDGILGFRIAPPVVGRRINLTAIRPVTSDTLLSTYFIKDGNTCFYGKCYYCRREEAACAEGEIMEGSVTLWLPDWYELKTWRHPWQRTYRPGVQARWEKDPNYCQGLLDPSSLYYHGLLEFTDTAVFDFLMGNADRHHYETYARAHYHGRLMHIDNGKSFGNPNHDEMSVLAPLTQCCKLRQSTWEKLLSLQDSEQGPLSVVLDESMKRDPVHPILTREHLEAIDRRHTIIIGAVNECIQKHGKENVLVSNWG